MLGVFPKKSNKPSPFLWCSFLQKTEALWGFIHVYTMGPKTKNIALNGGMFLACLMTWVGSAQVYRKHQPHWCRRALPGWRDGACRVFCHKAHDVKRWNTLKHVESRWKSTSTCSSLCVSIRITGCDHLKTVAFVQLVPFAPFELGWHRLISGRWDLHNLFSTALGLHSIAAWMRWCAI